MVPQEEGWPQEASTAEQDVSLHRLFLQIMRLYFHRNYERMDRLDIHPGQAPLLYELHKGDGLSQRELADRLLVRPSTITVTLRRLEKSGLVRRQADERDQRVSRVYLTDEGMATFRQLQETIDEIDQQTFAHFTMEERILMKRFFRQIRDNLAPDGETVQGCPMRDTTERRHRHRV